ncbi:MAG TPA: hypothetical protein VGQ53_21370 [Chitinophagaceae bacterium]|nr:hypothetical protein [Chitinophagaceae bacterium]
MPKPTRLYLLLSNTRTGQNQLDGTQMQPEKKEGKFIPFPIEDKPGVNQRRKKVGLKPLEDYLKEMNQ